MYYLRLSLVNKICSIAIHASDSAVSLTVVALVTYTHVQQHGALYCHMGPRTCKISCKVVI